MLAHSWLNLAQVKWKKGRKEEKRKEKIRKKEKILTTVQRNNRNLSEELVSVWVSFKRAKS